jgi:hypothetical protein
MLDLRRQDASRELPAAMAEGLEKEMRAKKYRPGWDSAFFIERATPEWEPRPWRDSGVIIVPDIDFNVARAIRAWRAIDIELTETHIRRHLAQMEAYERRLEKRQERRR